MLKYFNIFLITLFLCIVGCKNMDSQNKNNRNTDSICYLALGDSYTIGESVAEDERFPEQLKSKMQGINIFINELDIVAKTGWTTDELMNEIKTADLLEKYDLVTLLIGVNNQYRGRDTANYRSEFLQCLDTAIHKAQNDPNKVIVISIPDWGATPFAEGQDSDKIAEEIDAFNQINFEEAQKAGVHYVDVTAISRKAQAEPKLVASDGLHPSGEMYAHWVKAIFPVAFEILKNE